MPLGRTLTRSHPRHPLSAAPALRAIVVGLGFALLGLGASTASAQRTVPVEVVGGDPIPVVWTGATQEKTSTTTVCIDVEATCAPDQRGLPFGCFEADTIELSAQQPGAAAAGETRRRGDVEMGDLKVSAAPGLYSTKLFDAITKGRVFPEVAVCVAEPETGKALVEYKLQNAMVISWQTAVRPGSPGGMPLDAFSLGFEEIVYAITNGGVNTEATWSQPEASL